jgi:hypothetical protein
MAAFVLFLGTQRSH